MHFKKLFLLFIPLLVLVGCSSGTTDDTKIREQATESVSSEIVAMNNDYDFGKIAMDKGNVSIDFVLKNQGEEPVIITKMNTSCMCTTALLTANGQVSNEVGMPGHGGVGDEIYIKIEPGEEGTVTATYDPNAHGPMGTGINRRTVFVYTNSTSSPRLQLNFVSDVVATSDELATSEEPGDPEEPEDPEGLGTSE